MALTAEEAALLARYKTARQKLISGQALAEVRDENGQMKKFHQGDADALKDEIDALELKMIGTGGGRRRGAVSFRV